MSLTEAVQARLAEKLAAKSDDDYNAIMLPLAAGGGAAYGYGKGQESYRFAKWFSPALRKERSGALAGAVKADENVQRAAQMARHWDEKSREMGPFRIHARSREDRKALARNWESQFVKEKSRRDFLRLHADDLKKAVLRRGRVPGAVAGGALALGGAALLAQFLSRDKS